MTRAGELRRLLHRHAAGLVSAGVLMLSWVLPAASAPDDWVEILRQDGNGMELLLRAPEPVVEDGAVSVPGFQPVGSGGLPRVWSLATWIGVPGQGGASLEVLEMRRRPLAGVRARPQWDPVLERRAQELSSPPARVAVTPEGAYPAENVALVPAGTFRGVPVVQLSFAPLRFRADGVAEYVSEARVRLTFRDRARAGQETRQDTQLRALLNHASVRRWQLPPRPTAAPARQALPQDRLRITITDTGIYELTYDDLSAAGVPTQVDPRTFRLLLDDWHPLPLAADSFSSWSPSWELQEVDILVQGESDASFDPGDSIVFYAVGPSAYLDLVGASSDSLAHARHPYDRNRYAWLVWGDGMSTRRMQQVVVAAPAPISEPLVTEVWHRQHFEQDQQYGAVDDLWYWQLITTARPALASFPLDLGGALDETDGSLRLGVGAQDSYFHHYFQTTFNGKAFPTTHWPQAGFSFAPNHYVTYDSLTLRSSANQLSVRRVDNINGGETLFLEFDVTWQRPLTASLGTLAWTHRQSAPVEVFELAFAGTEEPIILDVTDHRRPIRLVQPTGNVVSGSTFWRVRYGRPGRGHYRATTSPNEDAPLQMRTIADLRSRPQAPHLLIVTHPTLRSEADRLLQHRLTHFAGDLDTLSSPDLLVTEVTDIYDSFSGGRVDPLAIRNYIKSLWDKDATPRLQFVLFFGEATHDPRRNLLSSTPTLVPTIHPWYADSRVRREGFYAIEDWFAEMGAPVFPDSFTVIHPLPDFATGRLTPRAPTDAKLIVDKIIAYETAAPTGAWRKTVLLAADDEHKGGSAVERFHINNIERLPPLVPPQWDVEKFYLTEYPLRLGQKPEARTAFIRRWGEGLGVLIYQGHGAPRQLADEVMFLSTDIPALVNGLRLPTFMAFSCTVAEFDDPELQSMAEELLTSPVGGAISTMGATRTTFAGPNARLNEQVFQAIWEFGPTSRVPLGTALMLGKLRSSASVGVDNARYVQVGDPSMPLRTPEFVTTFQSGADTLGAGAAARIQGRVETADGTLVAGFQGVADIAVYGSDDESGYNGMTPPLDYDLRGAPLYRGEVPVVDGTFSFDFFVPLNAVLGTQGTISVAAAAGGATAFGGRGDLVLQIAPVVASDTTGPEISLRFPNDRTHIKPGTELVAELQDPQGINIQGLTLFSSILLDFDNSNQPLDVTSFFRYQAGSATFGTVRIAVPGDLSPGPHTATLVAADNLQNPSSKSIGFEVVEEQVTQLVNVVAFPNPFRDRTHFIFEITDTADVEIQVFTLSGRQVWSYRHDQMQAGQVNVEWRGVDHVGDEIANGTYLYRVRATPRQAGSATLDSMGKVVVVREG